MPVLDVRRNVHHVSGLELLSGLAFLLIVPAPGNRYEYLPAAFARKMRVPLVIAARLKRYVEDTDLLERQRMQKTPPGEVFSRDGVGSSDGNNLAEAFCWDVLVC